MGSSMAAGHGSFIDRRANAGVPRGDRHRWSQLSVPQQGCSTEAQGVLGGGWGVKKLSFGRTTVGDEPRGEPPDDDVPDLTGVGWRAEEKTAAGLTAERHPPPSRPRDA